MKSLIEEDRMSDRLGGFLTGDTLCPEILRTARDAMQEGNQSPRAQELRARERVRRRPKHESLLEGSGVPGT